MKYGVALSILVRYHPTMAEAWQNSAGGQGQKRPVMLSEKVRETLRLKHYSLRTEEAYLGWVRRFIRFHQGRNPRELGEVAVREFLSHLAVREQVAASTQNQALNALVFLYREVLRQPLGDFSSLVRARRGKRLPVVLTLASVGGLYVSYKLDVPTGAAIVCVLGAALLVAVVGTKLRKRPA